jgi:hypothetical protein
MSWDRSMVTLEAFVVYLPKWGLTQAHRQPEQNKPEQ